MFEKYVEARKAKLVNESNMAVPAEDQNTQVHSKQALEAANTKRMLQILDMLKKDSSLAVKFALSPEEFSGVLDWAKGKFGGAPGESEEGGEGGDGSVAMGEAVEKAEKELEAAKNMKPKSEETEEEYLARRDSAIKAAIASKEEAEEHMALQSHYNTQNHALDLVDGLLKSPKKYPKADVIKILSLALDKLNNKS